MSLPKLDFRVLSSSTSEVSEGSLNELKRPLSKSRGWHSGKYCSYPQSIYIAFDTPINLRQINLLSHENQISEKISFYSYCPQGDISIRDYKTIPYLNFGYIKLNDNSNTNFKAREFKKVFVDVKCYYLRIDLDKNYKNAYNPLDQVCLINIEFFGYKLPGYKNSLINIEITDDNHEHLENLSPTKNNNWNNNKSLNNFLEEKCGDKLKELNEKLAESTKNQNSNECYKIKECINEINNIGKKLYDLEKEKSEAIKDENFDKAMELKESIEVLQKQISKIDTDKINTKRKRNHSSGRKSSGGSSGNNSFIDEKILEEIKEETENDNDNAIRKNKKKKSSKNKNNNKRNSNNNININANNNANINMPKENNEINKYNITNYSSISNNSGAMDLSQAKLTSIINSKDNSMLNEDDDKDIDYDERVVPAVKNKNKTQEEIDQENEKKYNKEIAPLKEIKKEYLEKYEALIDFIGEEGLNQILSKETDYRKKGIELLTQKLPEIFKSPDQQDMGKTKKKIDILEEEKKDAVYALFKLISELFEDTKVSMIVILLDFVYDTFKELSKYINNMKLSKKVINLIDEGIIGKTQYYLNNSYKDIRNKSNEIITFFLYNKIINFDLVINNLLSKEIKHKKKVNNSASSYILPKLDIIENILDNYKKIINQNISTEENFPKKIISDYLILQLNSSKIDIKDKSRAVTEIAIEKFGIDIFKQKLMDFTLKDIEKLKINNLKPMIDYLKEINNSLNLSPDYTMREIISRSNSNKPNEEGKKYKSKNKSRSKEKIDEKKKIESYNKCILCLKDLGNDNILEHMEKCLMCHQCKKCKTFVEIKTLTEHRINDCPKKDKFKFCSKCKEAYPIELFDEHLKKNKCNPYKKNCNRCPLCHEDIPLSKDAFFNHFMKDGCSYKIKYKNKFDKK